MIRAKVVFFPIFLIRCKSEHVEVAQIDSVSICFGVVFAAVCIVWFRFVFPYFSAPDVLVAGPGILASDHYLFRERRQ